ncbi:hypothetical protein QMK19_35245 [Streptomyces sp. H10-C2]|uniref:hypothetical protein n=1 Tax=unclassified Streptomyces TaxID=2593676 RepID=UPI0024BA5DF2|nr:MULTISPECIES: hypothetical protein [unclassified Streptomyces]MDJ0345891.1 hypothetical protein [Streptomyces sp. PH10-H1]MDJ0374740.1 hypothetical protein [Streptomyces sp. H10-C2]
MPSESPDTDHPDRIKADLHFVAASLALLDSEPSSDPREHWHWLNARLVQLYSLSELAGRLADAYEEQDDRSSAAALDELTEHYGHQHHLAAIAVEDYRPTAVRLACAPAAPPGE